MAGMMGLAVDLGWSYFTQKVAQASADGAALAAVHEAWARRGGLSSGWSCSTGNSAAYCQAASPADCATIQGDTSSNLYHGCLYAKNIGFNYSSATSHQNVRVQADVGPALGGSFPPTVTGILPANMVYWVTVRTVQTTPQLFSSMLGNTKGTVAAIATAAAVNTILPGSFYGLNHEGDCLTDGKGGAKYDCGVDIDVKSAGNTTCLDASGNNTNISGKVCAAGGIYLASSCNGGTTNVTGCTDPGNNSPNFAGSAQNNATVWGGNSTIVQNSGSVTSDGKVAGDSSWIPAHTNSSNSSYFQDPTHKLTQPPLMASSALSTCGVQGGNLPAGTWGPYQYYSYTNTDASGKPIPDGKTITVNSNNAVTFASNGACPGYSTSGAAAGSFPDYIFYGGLVMNPGGGNGGNSTTINFGSGQYVMAGTLNNTTVSGCDGPCVFAAVNNGNLNGSAGGTQFIFTDAKYPGLDTQVQAIPNYNNALSQIPNLVQGDIEIKNVTATLTAPQPSTGSTLAPWSNILFWQDRRNSADTVNVADGSVTSQSGPCSTCDVTATSPRFLMGPGGATLNLTGVLYQPRGSWFELTSGGSAASGNVRLQLITGALTCGSGGCGSATVQLLSPTAPIIEFVTALIQ